MTEMETISALRALFPVSPLQENAVFACDAELVRLGGALHGISVDEFSYEEDAFSGDDLPELGANLATAVVSDLLAAGCAPQFFLHTIVEPHGEEGFAVSLCLGVRDVLDACGCFLLGGDLGKSASWRYTGTALGQCMGTRPVTRILPEREQTLWITGAVGDGNLCALASENRLVLELRLREARAMNGVASACIDTSGGFADALFMLAHANPGHAFRIDSGAVPYADAARAYAARAGLPVEGFAFGGAGEYELLFATDPGVSLDFAVPVGSAVSVGVPGVYWNAVKAPQPPDPRSFSDRDEYVRELLQAVRLCLG